VLGTDESRLLGTLGRSVKVDANMLQPSMGFRKCVAKRTEERYILVVHASITMPKCGKCNTSRHDDYFQATIRSSGRRMQRWKTDVGEQQRESGLYMQ